METTLGLGLDSKTQAFLWRATMEILCVNAKLNRQYVREDNPCPVCGDGRETICHACSLNWGRIREAWVSTDLVTAIVAAPNLLLGSCSNGCVNTMQGTISYEL